MVPFARVGDGCSVDASIRRPDVDHPTVVFQLDFGQSFRTGGSACLRERRLDGMVVESCLKYEYGV